ncbi:hypothetical protein [Streptosporangium vulgare]|uniref:alpha/beta hydrolase family protein n=1 Tax=Streptosporangium vulgare TaxID=46190 RepID=UPI0031D6F37A
MTTHHTTGLTGPAPTATVSVKPLVLSAPWRSEDLHVRVTAPTTGTSLPVVLFAHGFGSNLDGYAPLVDHWAAGGFVVVQATHLDSKRLALPADDPRRPRMWRYRVQDMRRILDELTTLEASVPGLEGRIDHSHIVAAGHSFGGQTAGILVGLRVTDPDTGAAEDLSDARVMASIQLATAGKGGDELTPFARDNLPWLRENKKKGQGSLSRRRGQFVAALARGGQLDAGHDRGIDRSSARRVRVSVTRRPTRMPAVWAAEGVPGRNDVAVVDAAFQPRHARLQGGELVEDAPHVLDAVAPHPGRRGSSAGRASRLESRWVAWTTTSRRRPSDRPAGRSRPGWSRSRGEEHDGQACAGGGGGDTDVQVLAAPWCAQHERLDGHRRGGGRAGEAGGVVRGHACVCLSGGSGPGRRRMRSALRWPSLSRPRSSSGAWSTKARAPPGPPNARAGVDAAETPVLLAVACCGGAVGGVAPNMIRSGPSTSTAALSMRWL